jgi:hypothetical protein
MHDGGSSGVHRMGVKEGSQKKRSRSKQGMVCFGATVLMYKNLRNGMKA